MNDWRALGVSWRDGSARWEWAGPGGVSRTSPLPVGTELALAAGADRRCVGVWRSGRQLACPTAALIDPAARGARCASCQTLDRLHSVAADTSLDDPRPFTVYLAHHGTVVKVGITAVERGSARLLEQGALASTVLSTGPLPAARRCEHLLGTALGLPDRVTATRKRDARARPAEPGERAAALLATAERAHRLPGWPEGQARRDPPAVVDHTAAYPLPADGLRPAMAVAPLAPGQVLRGTVRCRIGGDLYLDAPNGDSGRSVLLDTRLLAGWALERAAADARSSAALTPLEHREDQAPLF
ncbi:DUF2797 domain-containing protein [Streptomyces profundus]|uniref:DUF2797 domain-containing protein n=1 Tax=Streptomyces profundus TaxID=2867410 RepID=UPI001D16DC7F|nr:DUF2797 domain-containing protein [Streptomyces sp. MA3_2.13]UED84479.1 DUF2797 domain-containing protein [Streptomyces sp. MA3_2.13]